MGGIIIQTMERTDKQTSPFLFQLVFTQLKSASPYFALNCVFTVLQFALLLAKLYSLIDPNFLNSLELPYPAIFVGLVASLGAFVGLTLFTSYFSLLGSIWVYGLLLLQALQVVFVEVGVQCFADTGWCTRQAKYELSVIVMLLAYIGLIYIRAQCYSPLQDGNNPFSMTTGRTILFLFLYAIAVGLSTNALIVNNVTAAQQLTFLLTCALYAVISDPPQANPTLARLFSVCTLGLMWTSGLIWLAPIFQSLLNIDGRNALVSFWLQWGYSFPIVIGLGIVQSASLGKGYQWKLLFADCRSDDLKSLYLQIAQLTRVMEVVRRSQLRANSSEFKVIWQLVGAHNKECKEPQCCLKTLQGLRIQRGDQLMQQKRFSKTVQKVLQFGLHRLVRQKDIFPNSIPLNLQIANYELEVFHQRTKGLQLYNREYGRPGLGRQQAWGMFYLRRKIEGFDSNGQARAKGESEQQISAFKHDIEVSVSLLAEFWFFLSDPKCNLKKLYDLANVLFPMKIRVDRTWRSIRTLRSIECYNLYARYLIKMFNDKEKGIHILEEARKIEAENSQKEEITAGIEGTLNEEHGVIFLEFDGKNSGIMYQVNTACELIFGYGKGELQGRKVNDIMPRVIAFHHDKILQHYQQTNRPRMMNKERTIWGRAKDGYLFPFTICIKPVRNYYSQTSQVYASVKRELWVRESAFFFTDSELNLTDASSSLLSFFPNLHGRLHLKKKVNIEEIAPEYARHHERVIHSREAYQFTVERSFSIGDGRHHTEKIPVSLVGQEVSVNVSGFIGYYFRIIKSGGSSYGQYDPSNASQQLRQGNADASNSYWMKRQNDFRFMASMGDSDNKKVMVYHGGLVHDHNQTKQLIYSRIQSSFLLTKQANQQQEDFQRRQYGGDIKMRRLQGGVFREIHELTEESEQNNNAGSGQHQQQEEMEMVKPSELNAILSRQNGSRHINLLKISTLAILLLSTLLAVFQYALTYSHAQTLTSSLSTLADQNSLQSQIMYLNLFANLFSLGLVTPQDVTIMRNQINQLNSLAGAVPYSVSTTVTYSDGSNQTMILAFAINKLISQAQLLAAAATFSPDDPDLFFVQFNSVNGLEAGCEQALLEGKKTLLSMNDSVLGTYAIYLGVSAGAYVVMLLIKNLILRAVLRKKAEILNVFFEIPRYACSAIQKECERFIQRLTMDQEEQEFQVEAQVQDESRRYSKQKKRTIMGQQKTATNFVLVSLLLLAFLLLYPSLVIMTARNAYRGQQYSITAISEIIRFQKEMAKLNSFIDTHYARPNYPLSYTNATQIVSGQYNNMTVLFSNIQEYLYYLTDVFSSDYLNQYNSLFFVPLCDSVNTPNCSLYGQNKGLNSLFYYYFDYAIGKSEKYATNTTPPLGVARSSSVLQAQQSLRILLKKYWRQLNGILLSGLDALVRGSDSLLFAVMLAVCIVNMTVLLWAWIRFYNSLGQKIIATEYILTFIPIDQINKNPKIAKYIKEQVLRAQ